MAEVGRGGGGISGGTLMCLCARRLAEIYGRLLYSVGAHWRKWRPWALIQGIRLLS